VTGEAVGDPDRVDFYIVGAPKSGTTAMHEYLRRHPGIYMPDLKEPHFWATDIPTARRVLDREAYSALFAEAGPGQLKGEASVWYMYSKDAARHIAEATPDARIVAMVRDPVDFMASLHAAYLYSGSEDIASFREALEAESDRRNGRRIPPGARAPLLYRDAARFGAQLSRYLERFPGDRLHVIVFDDFVIDPAAVYRRLLSFLGADPDVRVPHEQINPRRRARSRFVSRILYRPPTALRRSAALLPPAVKRIVWTEGLWKLLDRLNSERISGGSVDGVLRRQLYDDLLEDVELLGRIAGRDLVSLWIPRGRSGRPNPTHAPGPHRPGA
jgi:hypothetical protein